MEQEWPTPPAERFTSQADGKHPAPCARSCEANAFAIEMRQLRARLERAEQGARRYEVMRRMSAEAFAELIRTCISGGARFDEQVDALVPERMNSSTPRGDNPNQCATCGHKPHGGSGGHCYMFREAPTETCQQHTGRRAMTGGLVPGCTG